MTNGKVFENDDLINVFKKISKKSDDFEEVPKSKGFNSANATNIHFLLASTLSSTLDLRLKRRKIEYNRLVEEFASKLQDDLIEEQSQGEEEIARLIQDFRSIQYDKNMKDEHSSEVAVPLIANNVLFSNTEDQVFSFDESAPIGKLPDLDEGSDVVVEREEIIHSPSAIQSFYGSLPISVPVMNRRPSVEDLGGLSPLQEDEAKGMTQDQIQSRSLMVGNSLLNRNMGAEARFEPPHVFSARTFQDTSLVGKPSENRKAPM
jgi:hypothetical protein